jgi:hypothetical protein
VVTDLGALAGLRASAVVADLGALAVIADLGAAAGDPATLDPVVAIAALLPATGLPVVADAGALPAACLPVPLRAVVDVATADPDVAGARGRVAVARRRIRRRVGGVDAGAAVASPATRPNVRVSFRQGSFIVSVSLSLARACRSRAAGR